MSLIVIFFIGVLAGTVVAVFVTALIFSRRRQNAAIGTLQIVEANGEEPYLFLSLDTDIASFAHDSKVTMYVTHRWASRK